MEEAKVVGRDTTQYVVVRLGEEKFGVDIKFIDSIVRMQSITRVPKAQEYIKGVINLRGEVVPVMNIRVKMHLPESEITKATRIIILKLEQYGTIGILVDEVTEVITIENDTVEKISYDINDETEVFISGIGKNGNDLISLLDFNLVMQEKENV